jgi:hypothetical protein
MKKTLLVGIIAVLLVATTLAIAQRPPEPEPMYVGCGWENATETIKFTNFFQEIHAALANNCVEFGFTFPDKSFRQVRIYEMKMWGIGLDSQSGSNKTFVGYLNGNLIVNQTGTNLRVPIFYNMLEGSENSLKTGINELTFCGYGTAVYPMAVYIDYDLKPANC